MYSGRFMAKIEIFGVSLPEIREGDNIAKLIVERFQLEDGDIVVITSKIVSKAKGLVVRLDSITPSEEAVRIAEKVGKDARLVELILRRGKIIGIIPVYALASSIDISAISDNPKLALELMKKDQTLLLTLVNGQIYSDAGIDASNHPEGFVSIPPDAMEAAREIREEIARISGRDVAVLIADTEVFFGGSLDVCRGYAGIHPVSREFGREDRFGRPKYGGVDAIVHELCCAAALLFGQTSAGIPVAVIRGVCV